MTECVGPGKPLDVHEPLGLGAPEETLSVREALLSAEALVDPSVRRDGRLDDSHLVGQKALRSVLASVVEHEPLEATGDLAR